MIKIEKSTKICLILFIIAFFLLFSPIWLNLVFSYLYQSTGINIFYSINEIQYSESEFLGRISVVRPGSYRPVANADVEIFINKRVVRGSEEGQNFSTKLKTQADGNTPSFNLPSLKPGEYSIQIKAKYRGAEEIAYGYFTLLPGNETRVYIYSDRKIYKPGDEIHVAGQVWFLNYSNMRYSPIDGFKIEMSLINPDKLTILKKDLFSDEYGQFSGSILLDSEAKEGNYTFIFNKEANYTVKVEKYVKPKIKLDLIGKTWVKSKENATITFSARYIFDEPVKNAEVKYLILYQRYYYEYEGGRILKQGTCFTNENGTCSVSFSVPECDYYGYPIDTEIEYTMVPRRSLLIERVPPYRWGCMPIIVKANVTDINKWNQTMTKTLTISDKNIRISIDTDKLKYKKDEEVTLFISAAYPDNTPVSKEEAFLLIKKVTKDGIEDFIAQKIRLDENGFATYRFDYPSAEYLILNVTIANETSTFYINLYYPCWWYNRCKIPYVPTYYTNKNIILSLNKKEFEVNENIEIEIYSKKYTRRIVYVDVVAPRAFDKYNVLLDSEGKGKLSIKAKPEYSLVSEIRAYVPGDYNAKREFVVFSDKQMDIGVFFETKTYKPRETISLELRAKPYSKLTIGLVDESVLLLAENQISPFNFFYNFTHSVARQSIATAYYTAPSSTSMLLFFLGILILIVAIIFGSVLLWRKGHKLLVVIGLVIIILVMFGLFIFFIFLSARVYYTDGVSRIEIAPQIMYEKLGVPTIEGIERVPAILPPTGIMVRYYFPDTGYWNTEINTGASGRTSLNITLPDTITTWRLMVSGITKQADAGDIATSVLSKKNFFVELDAPSQAVVEDLLTVSTSVFNYQNETISGYVSIAQSPKFKVIGLSTREIKIQANSIQRIQWKLNITSYGITNITAIAFSTDGNYTDAISKEIQIKPRVEPIVNIFSGQIASGVSHNFTIYPDAVDEFTRAKIVIQPTLLTVSVNGIEELAHYPYGCVEQTMSSTFPNILIKKILIAKDALDPYFAKKIDAMIESGISRLYSFRHYDGGWGWWENDATNTFMTAYVLFGLSQAKSIGFYIDDRVISEAQNRLISFQAYDGRWIGTHWLYNRDIAMTAYVLISLLESGYDKNSPSILNGLNYLKKNYQNVNDPYTLSLISIALTDAGQTNTEIVDRLVSLAKENEYWDGESMTFCRWCYREAGDVETTAYAAIALLKTNDPKYLQLCQNAINFLISRRGYYGWKSTKDTSAALLAISEYLKLASTDTEINADLDVYVNGLKIASYHIDQTNKEIVRKLDIKSYLIKGENVVRIEKTGEGKLYYTLNVEQIRKSFGINLTYINVDKRYEKLKMNVGESINVNINLSSAEPIYYVIVEDTIPAGFEIDESSLKTTNNIVRYEINGNVLSYFIISLRQENINYRLKAVSPSLVHVKAAKAYAMYSPDLIGFSQDYSLEIV